MPARILIIEDNPANLELARFLLVAHGYSTLAASDGGEGVRIIREARPDLVLCDLQMPVLDGYAVLAAIRNDPELNGTLVVAVTAFSMPGDRITALAAGFDGYVSKPIDPAGFVAEIESFLPAGLRVPRPAAAND
jgi:CheY-like chemotaxis protein